MKFKTVVSELTVRRNKLAGELQQVEAAIAALRRMRGSKTSGSKPRRTMSAAGRRRISLAQKSRWAKWRKSAAKT